MRQGQQNRRGRSRNRKSQSPLTRAFESNGPDVKLRGTPAHIAEKYISLARDALASGDPVLAENYLQHAEHYNRIIMQAREQQLQGQPAEYANGNGNRFRSGNEFADGGDDDDDFDGDEIGSDGRPAIRGYEPQPSLYENSNAGDERTNRPRHGREREHRGGEQRFPDERPAGRMGDQRHTERGERGDRGEYRGEGRGDHRGEYRGEPRGDHRGERPHRDRRDTRHEPRERRHQDGRGGFRTGHRDGGGGRDSFAGEGGEREPRRAPVDPSDGGQPPLGYAAPPMPAAGDDHGGREARDLVARELPVREPVPRDANGTHDAPPPRERVAEVAPPRRRERPAIANPDQQPDFLKKPIRRPRRETPDDGAPTATAQPINGAAGGHDDGSSDTD